ncbi:MAG: AAA family ATPase [Deltaproteobacteria bacterium]|nr:MAG: AAA family ATPase [Deltaproteobacteria bacterium]
MSRNPTALALPTTDGYSYGEVRALVELTLRAGISVLLRGHPGVGKSALAHELASAMGLPLEDIRLAQRDPAELAGVYFPDRERQVLALFAPDWVQRACEVPTLVFLDEINAAVTRLHQAAAYQIVLEHRVGPFRFHPGTVVLAAGNLEEDHALAATLSAALTNRFAHYTLRVDAASWLTWGADAGVDEAILAYIGRYGEEALYSNDGEYAFPSPRSWEMASRVYRAATEAERRRAVAACVGAAAAEKLFAYLRIYQRVNAARIVRKGQAMDFARGKSAEPSFIYAALFSVAAWLNHEGTPTDDELPNVVAFLRSPGLDPEYVFLFLRQVKGNAALMARLKGLPEFRALAGELVRLSAELYR